MTKDELIQFLKENLKIEIETNSCSGDSWYSIDTCLSIKLILNEEEICNSTIRLNSE